MYFILDLFLTYTTKWQSFMPGYVINQSLSFEDGDGESGRVFSMWTVPVWTDKPEVRSEGVSVWQSDNCTGPSLN